MKSELLDKVLEWRNVVVVDFENYQCIPTDLLNEEYVYYLFCGATTTKCANAYKEMLNAYDVYRIYIWKVQSKTGYTCIQ